MIDNKAEKYYSWSPYAYAINNPVKFVDPDGNDIYIWSPGQNKPFIFNGKNVSSAPNNAYVQNVLKAYDYDVSNGGGDNLKEAASNPDLQISISIGNNGDESENIDGYEYVRWDSNEGLLTEEGSVLSAATLLEHEMDHSVDRAKAPLAHGDRSKPNGTKYTNKEEERVINGSEKKTGTANGEFKKGEQRKSHGGTTVVVNGSTSTKVNKEKTNAQLKKMEDAGYDTSKDRKRVNRNVK